MHKRQRRIDTIRESLRGHDDVAIRQLERDYDDVVKRIAEIEKSLEGQLSKRGQAEADHRRAQAALRRLKGVDPTIRGETAAWEVLERVFDLAIGRFRDQLRLQVQDAATEIFRQLTTASDMERLTINSTYGLRIVATGEREITTRSAGAEQIVALSLIGALNKCAVREGPVVMDTPFGRLDRAHRENILRYVPQMSRQVILLVQSGEFERNRDLPLLDGLVAREYELVQHGSSTQTEVHALVG